MAFERRPNRGNIFRNKDKKEERHPDFKANGKDSILLELPGGGTIEVEVAIWKKSSDKAKEYLSVSLKAVGATTAAAPPPVQADPTKPPF